MISLPPGLNRLARWTEEGGSEIPTSAGLPHSLSWPMSLPGVQDFLTGSDTRGPTGRRSPAAHPGLQAEAAAISSRLPHGIRPLFRSTGGHDSQRGEPFDSPSSCSCLVRMSSGWRRRGERDLVRAAGLPRGEGSPLTLRSMAERETLPGKQEGLSEERTQSPNVSRIALAGS